MIKDHLSRSGVYEKMGPAWEAAFRYLKSCEKAFPAPGQYEIDGKRIFASVQQYATLPGEECGWEAHRKYIDIQYLFEGNECIGFAPVQNMTDPSAYSEEKDCLVSERAEEETPLFLHPGDFAVFFPQDAHKPRCQCGRPENIRKVVVKLLVQE
ncbi:MAG: YhcH/YjgK/YiaL family protein [Clostridiales bacterium]|nr:YhcH/YjgK/YiaL family protein [Clostridiales bacterium]